MSERRDGESEALISSDAKTPTAPTRKKSNLRKNKDGEDDNEEGKPLHSKKLLRKVLKKVRMNGVQGKLILVNLYANHYSSLHYHFSTSLLMLN